jgi:hypothetical protein
MGTMKNRYILSITFIMLFFVVSCSQSDPFEEDLPVKVDQEIIGEVQTDYAVPGGVPDYSLIMPEDFEYLGFFRLPGPSGGSDWDYSGHGLTYYPEGDPGGEGDGFPGSLFGFGHDQQLFVSEISIPEPTRSGSLEQANTAVTLQPFGDLTAGIFSAEEMTIPRAGLAYLANPEPLLHFTFAQHIQDFEPSHGWGGLQLDQPNARGPWIFDGFTNYVTNDYLFEIPDQWGAALGSGPFLASGRAREGLWSGRGPALFAYQPGDGGKPPRPGAVQGSIYPLLLYGEQISGLPDLVSSPAQAVIDYRDADHWWGGAWLTGNDSAAVVFAGTKALGDEWYGFANGEIWEHDCAENSTPSCPDVPDWPYDDRGFWAEGFQAQLIFYDPGQFIAVARGEIDSWEPQPYAMMILDEYLLDPVLNIQEYKRDLVGAAAFDRENGFFFLVERLADDYRSVVHIWKINP